MVLSRCTKDKANRTKCLKFGKGDGSASAKVHVINPWCNATKTTYMAIYNIIKARNKYWKDKFCPAMMLVIINKVTGVTIVQLVETDNPRGHEGYLT